MPFISGGGDREYRERAADRSAYLNRQAESQLDCRGCERLHEKQIQKLEEEIRQLNKLLEKSNKHIEPTQ